MPKNEYLPFGTAANANVLPNADYQALPARSAGFTAGVAKSKELNTAWRQASVIANVVAQFIADKSGKDVLDNGDTAGLLSSLEMAFAAQTKETLPFSQLLAANGYQKLPSGLIIQWLSGVSGNNGVMSLPLPIPFPTAVLGGVVNEGNPVGWNENDATIWGFDLPSSSKTTVVARVRKISGQLGPAPAGSITGRIFVWGF
ncbi:hypothetical protein J8628_02355 [Serratia fonticola]|uniref:gp53-like domain-containing protein n=1 Tax=Serratia fonticola TaxID=47917 RepID=UPI001AE329C4|nr:hypothetical protein [Serratia fonticola]MBP1015751.1 hypothetical protein [Serratia fonticola]